MTNTTKRRWFRFSLKGLLILVTLVGLSVATALIWRRATTMHLKSQTHLNQAAALYEVVHGFDQLPAPNPQQIALRNKFQKQFEFHANLSLECEEAIWRPWRSVDEGQQAP